MSNLQTVVTKDVASKKISLTREFNADLELVWQAYTDSDILDQWWAPKPWKAETKAIDFREGGYWLYAMVGPEGERHWARVDYTLIQPLKRFEAVDSFCNENGENTNTDLPSAEWLHQFSETPHGTRVATVLSFATETDMRAILEMGFEEGMLGAIGNLVDWLADKAQR